MKILAFLLCAYYCLLLSEASFVNRISEIKEFQRQLKLRTNVLVIAAKRSGDVSRDLLSTLEETGKAMKGVADIVLVDCSDAKKVCKKFKFSPNKVEIKHFSDGRYHKDYDRALKSKSMITFLKSPKEEAPWSEDPSTKDVTHIEEAKELMSVFRREKKRSVLLMFYTPWCGHCKKMKPEFTAAASKMKKEVAFVGIDCQKSENYALQQGFNVSGFPTILLMKGGELAGRYMEGPKQDSLIAWLRDPSKQSIDPEPPAPPAEEPWKSDNVAMLTDDGFDDYLATNPSVLVMFYAPWCGHCKNLKPVFEDAAKTTAGKLAAVDATKETALGKQFKIQGYPSLKYFENGEFKYDVNFRSKDEILKFMANPEEPPKEPESSGWEQEEGAEAVFFLDDDSFYSTMKKKKNSLIMFYAPWCGHCKAAKPHYIEAAQSFANNAKVAFAAVDCTKSKTVCSDFDVKGFPTLISLNYGKNPQPYEGQRDTAAFTKFMNAQINKKTEL